MNPITLELRAMADRLRELFPEATRAELHTVQGDPSTIEVNIFGCNYDSATELLRRSGAWAREKRAYDGSAENQGPWSTLTGLVEGVEIKAFCEGLPPSCRIETTTRRIPKTAVVDTGEYIEVQERIVKCSPAEVGA